MRTQIATTHEYPRSRAARQLRELISGRYGDGDWLPAEHELCVKMSVSRGTLRSAMKDLESEGWLRAEAGRGRMVTRAKAVPKTMMMDAVAVVTHESNPVGHPAQSGTDPFIQMSAIDSIRRAGLHALVVQPDLLAQDGLKRFISERPRGIVMMRRAVESELARSILSSLAVAGVPVVLYGESPALSDFDSVVSDHYAGSYQLTKWLIERGRRRILRLWQLSADAVDRDRRPEWLGRRDAGHEAAMLEAGLEVIPPLEHRDLNSRDATSENFQAFTHVAIGQLMPYFTGSDPVDSIMLVSDGVLAPVAAACRMFGKIPGQDVLLVGYDNFWQDDPTRRCNPAIPAATIDKRNGLLGAQLIELLLARADGTAGEVQHRLIQPELIILSP